LGMVLVGTDTIKEAMLKLRPTNTNTKLFPKKAEKDDDHEDTEEQSAKNVQLSQVTAPPRRQPAHSPPGPMPVSANGLTSTVSTDI